jgi:hypothetical protein
VVGINRKSIIKTRTAPHNRSNFFIFLHRFKVSECRDRWPRFYSKSVRCLEQGDISTGFKKNAIFSLQRTDFTVKKTSLPAAGTTTKSIRIDNDITAFPGWFLYKFNGTAICNVKNNFPICPKDQRGP